MDNTQISPEQNWRLLYESTYNLYRHQNERIREMRLEIQRLKLELFESNRKVLALRQSELQPRMARPESGVQDR